MTVAFAPTPSSMPTLTTPRLVLRRFQLGDLRDVWAYASDPEVSRWVLWDTHRSLDDTRSFLRWTLEAYQSPEPSAWAIVSREDGHVVGSIGFAQWTPAHGRAEVGYVLARRLWGRGLMTEATAEVLRWGFVGLGLHKIVAHCHVDNVASRRVLSRAGMKYEGTLHAHLFVKGAFWDVDVFGLTASSFRASAKSG